MDEDDANAAKEDPYSPIIFSRKQPRKREYCVLPWCNAIYEPGVVPFMRAPPLATHAKKRREFIRRIGRDDDWSARALKFKILRVCAIHCTHDADGIVCLKSDSELSAQMKTLDTPVHADICAMMESKESASKTCQPRFSNVMEGPLSSAPSPYVPRPPPRERDPNDAPEPKMSKQAKIDRL
jgi:hypothetical protein